ncbi:hypothetical protein NpNSSI1_00012772 [Neofusicoccum parvum]|nr:hypothetical protein NpNSSI1_00012772 [Neofusicoccum parvum]
MQSATSSPSQTASQASQNRDISGSRPSPASCATGSTMNQRTSARRKNLASCRLGDVSRTVREEFAPMLRAALQHFSICTCRAADETGRASDDQSRDPARGMLEPLRGRVQYLTLDKHGGAIYTRMQEMRHLGSALMFLRFKGQFKVVATETYAESIQRALSIYETMSEGVALIESGRAFALIQQTLLYSSLHALFRRLYHRGEDVLLDFSLWST